MLNKSLYIKISLGLFFILLNLNHAASQPYKLVTYSNKDGFNQNTIFAIEQDKFGFLWIGTSNGLIRYDGYFFENFTWELSDPSIISSRILDIHSDSRGLLWIVTVSGLTVYYPDFEEFFKVIEDPGNRLNRIVEDENGSMWVAGNNYLLSVWPNLRNDTIIFDYSSNFLAGTSQVFNINDLLVTGNGSFLTAANSGLFQIYIQDNEKQNGNILIDTLLSGENIQRILNDENIIWIGTNSGLYKTTLENKRLHILNKYTHIEGDQNSLSNNIILDLFIGNSSELWIGSQLGGISRYNEDDDSFTNYTYNPKKSGTISSPHVNCIYEDQFNVLWIGTAQGGLGKLDLNQKEFNNLSNNPFDDQTLPGNLINSIVEDSKGYLWIASYRSPLCRSTTSIYDDNITDLSFNRFESWYNSYNDKNIELIYEDKNGIIWLGYSNSLVIYNPDTEVFSMIRFEYSRNSIDLGSVRNIIQLSDEKLLLAGSTILILDNPWKYIKSDPVIKIPVLTSYSFSENNESIAALVDHKGQLWVGLRDNGLSVFNLYEDTLRLSRTFNYSDDADNCLSNNAVFCLKEDNEKNIWIGTFGGGLNKITWDPEDINFRFEHIRNNLGYSDNAIYGIIEENDSIFWLSTDLGIRRLNVKSREIVNYDVNDGLASNNFRRNAFHKGRSGYFYFGGLNGLTVFRPGNIEANVIHPELKIVNLKINNKRVILEKHVSEISHLSLKPFDRTVSFDILVQHYSSPQKNSLVYLLEGFDNEWIEVNSGKFTATYTSLPPGKYIFRVKGFNGDGIPSTEDIELPVNMMAPWYDQLWSKILLGMIILLFVAAVSWYYIKLKILKNSLQYEQKDKERIHQINQSRLRFFTNLSHEFKTPLALISAPIQKLEEVITEGEQRKYISIISRNTKKLINLIDQLLTFRKIEQGYQDLRLTRITLGDFIYPITEAFETYSLRNAINFYHNVKDSNIMVVMDCEKMERVLFNLLSNAFKFTPENGTVSLEGRIFSSKTESYLRFDVSDTGRGIQKEEIEKIFERFYQVDSELSNPGIGIGLAYSKAIVELHGGHFKIESQPGLKTCFSVFLPLNFQHESQIKIKEMKGSNIEQLLNQEEVEIYVENNGSQQVPFEYTILVVDDEEDFRDLLKDILHLKYNIIQARNGKEALEKTIDRQPDVIISDVLMPEMNGYELCREVKSDIRMCHIPVILITALGDDEMQIKGVEYGADSYITKPFNVKYLIVSIQKLIENRKKIKEHFSHSSFLPKDISISNTDQNFICSVNEAIDKNLDDSDFGVEELACEVGLSTSQFYRKLKSLTGQIPNAYLRNYRLQKAAEILSNYPGVSIKSVMYEIGIESPSHFTHAFRKKFGISPSEFINRLS